MINANFNSVITRKGTGIPSSDSYELLLENGDALLLESGDYLLLESNPESLLDDLSEALQDESGNRITTTT